MCFVRNSGVGKEAEMLFSHFTEWMMSGTRPYKTSQFWNRKDQAPRMNQRFWHGRRWTHWSATTANHSTHKQITGGAGGCSNSQPGLWIPTLPTLHPRFYLCPSSMAEASNFLAEACLLIIFIFDCYLLAVKFRCLSTSLKVAGKEINLSRTFVHRIWAAN